VELHPRDPPVDPEGELAMVGIESALDKYHASHAHRSYGMSCDQFDDLYRSASGRCEICGVRGEDTPTSRLFIDHDQAVGYYAVRGLLCNSCNTLLGIRGGGFTVAAEAYLTAKSWHVGRLMRRRRGQRIADGHVLDQSA